MATALDAIRAVVEDRANALVVQRTGWGKSAVYLISTRLIRDNGGGPTVIVSPLVALMRNQLAMTRPLALNAEVVYSANRDEWDRIFEAIQAGEIDLLLISPERLNNQQFRREVMPQLFSDIGLLVIDEVHCISDWGHDFRPDYRRLRQVVVSLPPGVPVLGTTATANDRVVTDVEEQLGSELQMFRGTLERESLALQVLGIENKAERMAWLAETIPRLSGSGIVYCLTIHDADRVAEWLRSRGIDAAAYTGPLDHEARLEIRICPQGDRSHPHRSAVAVRPGTPAGRRSSRRSWSSSGPGRRHITLDEKSRSAGRSVLMRRLRCRWTKHSSRSDASASNADDS